MWTRPTFELSLYWSIRIINDLPLVHAVVEESACLTSAMKLLSCCLARNLLTFWCILLSFSSSSRSAQRQWRYELRQRHSRRFSSRRSKPATLLVDNIKLCTADHTLICRVKAACSFALIFFFFAVRMERDTLSIPKGKLTYIQWEMPNIHTAHNLGYLGWLNKCLPWQKMEEEQTSGTTGCKRMLEWRRPVEYTERWHLGPPEESVCVTRKKKKKPAAYDKKTLMGRAKNNN